MYTFGMSTDESRSEPAEFDPRDRIPEDGLVIKQVPWAWVWSSMPWLVLAVILVVSGLPILDDPILLTLFIVVIVVPRYLRWRRTEYVLTRDTLFYQQGGLAGAQKYEVPISTLRDVRSRFGMFGKSLGYQTVDVMLDNGAVASLQYVASLHDLGSLIQGLIDASTPTDESTEDSPSEDGPASSEDRS